MPHDYRRVRQSRLAVVECVIGSGALTYFLYDGSLPVCELGSTGSLLATNTFGANGLVSRHTAASEFYAFDPQGSVTERLTKSGAISGTTRFEAFGTGATLRPWGYGAQGGGYTDETNLVLLGHRYYDPSLGRFINRDPIGYAGGVNLYNYTGNDPINGNDPSGLAQDAGGSNDTVRLSLAAFIPVASVGGFKGDNRSFSSNSGHYRTEQNVIVNLKLGTVHILLGRVGGSHLFTGHYVGTASNDGMTGSFSRSSCGNYDIILKEDEGNPFFHGLAPSIRYNIVITIDSQGHILNWQGKHSGYPAFELYSYQNGMQPVRDFSYMPNGTPLDLAKDVPFAHNP